MSGRQVDSDAVALAVNPCRNNLTASPNGLAYGVVVTITNRPETTLIPRYFSHSSADNYTKPSLLKEAQLTRSASRNRYQPHIFITKDNAPFLAWRMGADDDISDYENIRGGVSTPV